MRGIIAIVLFTSLAFSCKRPENPQRNELVMTGVITAEADTHRVNIQQVLETGSGSSAKAVENATVTAFFEGNRFDLEPHPDLPGAYFITGLELALTYFDFIEFEAETDEHVLAGSAELPAPVAIESISSQDVTIDPTSSGAPLINLSWTAIPDALYVLKLDTIGSDHEVIPYAGGGGSFDLYFGLPLTNEFQTIFDIDFQFTGEHQLTVFVIDPDYEGVFLYPNLQSGQDLLSSPDNITNGSGYLTGVSRVSISLNVSL